MNQEQLKSHRTIEDINDYDIERIRQVDQSVNECKDSILHLEEQKQQILNSLQQIRQYQSSLNDELKKRYGIEEDEIFELDLENKKFLIKKPADDLKKKIENKEEE